MLAGRLSLGQKLASHLSFGQKLAGRDKFWAVCDIGPLIGPFSRLTSSLPFARIERAQI
jgi:hypothetical protein